MCYYQQIEENVSLIHIYRRLLQNVSTISCSHLQVALVYKGYVLS